MTKLELSSPVSVARVALAALRFVEVETLAHAALIAAVFKRERPASSPFLLHSFVHDILIAVTMLLTMLCSSMFPMSAWLSFTPTFPLVCVESMSHDYLFTVQSLGSHMVLTVLLSQCFVSPSPCRDLVTELATVEWAALACLRFRLSRKYG